MNWFGMVSCVKISKPINDLPYYSHRRTPAFESHASLWDELNPGRFNDTGFGKAGYMPSTGSAFNIKPARRKRPSDIRRAHRNRKNIASVDFLLRIYDDSGVFSDWHIGYRIIDFGPNNRAQQQIS